MCSYKASVDGPFHAVQTRGAESRAVSNSPGRTGEDAGITQENMFIGGRLCRGMCCMIMMSISGGNFAAVACWVSLWISVASWSFFWWGNKTGFLAVL
jgi:hypothetical protein